MVHVQMAWYFLLPNMLIGVSQSHNAYKRVISARTFRTTDSGPVGIRSFRCNFSCLAGIEYRQSAFHSSPPENEHIRCVPASLLLGKRKQQVTYARDNKRLHSGPRKNSALHSATLPLPSVNLRRRDRRRLDLLLPLETGNEAVSQLERTDSLFLPKRARLKGGLLLENPQIAWENIINHSF